MNALFRRLRRLVRGVTITHRGKRNTVRLVDTLTLAPNGRDLWRMSYQEGGEILLVIEGDLLHLRKMAVQFYPQIARYFGSPKSWAKLAPFYTTFDPSLDLLDMEWRFVSSQVEGPIESNALFFDELDKAGYTATGRLKSTYQPVMQEIPR